MSENFTVSLDKIIKEFKLESIYLPEREVLIDSADVNRPGLQMAGYFEFFDENRIQIIGKAEESFLQNFTPEKARSRMEKLFSKNKKEIR